MQIAETIEDFVRRRIYAGRYVPDRKMEGALYARRFDDGSFPTIFTIVGRQAPLGAANYIGRNLEGQPALFLCCFFWAAHGRRTVRRTQVAHAIYRDRRPEHHFILLCNDKQAVDAFAGRGVETVLFNHNALVDEKVFVPTDMPDRYDAVYNGAIAGWKRHGLSQLIESCVQITYKRSDVSQAETTTRLADLRRLMPTHHFANTVVDDKIQMISGAGVAALLNQSRCGLCLSAEEGAMFASMEYLLTGLPVVSTPSVGGREEFADPEYWLTVDDNPAAVAAGVQEMIGRKLPREYIRTKTLRRVHEHRARLRDTVIRATGGKVLLPADLTDPTYRFMTDIGSWPPVTELAKVLSL